MDNGDASPRPSAAPQSFRTGVLLLGIVLALLIGWQVIRILLMLFAAISFAVLLNGFAAWIAHRTRLSYRPALAAGVAGLLAAAGLAYLLLFSQLYAQAGRLTSQLPETYQQLRAALVESNLPNLLPSPAALGAALESSVLSRVTDVAGLIVDIIGGGVITLVIGLYLAANPALYRDGLIFLLPPARRARGRQVLDHLGAVLRRWLLARLIFMFSLGVTATIGLSLIGVPLALILGVIVGLLNFVPYIGPALGGILSVLVAAPLGTTTVLYVLALYIGLQMIDGYLVQPVVEQRMVLLPPALTLAMQVVLGTLVGALGILFASPLAAVGLALVKMLYMQDVLGEHVEVVNGEE